MSIVAGRHKPIACVNLNHRRRDAPVRHCPLCGEVVNAEFDIAQCEPEEHRAARRKQTRFCLACGDQLMW